MASNEVKPADTVRHGPEQRLPHLHNQPGKAAHHLISPHTHVTPPERTRLREVPLDEAQSLRTGLELFEKKTAEAAEARDPKLQERFRQLIDQHPEAFETAFDSLQTDRGRVSGADYYDHLYRGLELICRNNTELLKLPFSDRIDALLFGTGKQGPLSADTIVKIFRAGEAAEKSRALRAGGAPFLEAYLAMRWNESWDESSASEPAVRHADLNCFLVAAELIVDHYDAVLRRLAQAVQEESVRRAAATKRWAERKDNEHLEENLSQKMMVLAALELEVEKRAGLSLQDAAPVKLGRAVLSARMEPADIVLGLSQLGSVEEVLERLLPLPETEAADYLARAGRWGQLSGQLAGMPEELLELVKTHLFCGKLSPRQINEAFAMLADPRQRGSLDLGYQAMLPLPGLAVSCFRESAPLQRLVAFGEYGRQFQQALAARDNAKLVPAIMLCSDPDVQTKPDDEFSVHSKRLMIVHVFQTAGPAAIPVLIEAGDAALARLPRRQDLPLRTEIVLFIAKTVINLCQSPEAVTQLIQTDPPPAPHEPGLAELFPIRRLTKQFVLNALLRPSHDPPPAGTENWSKQFKAEIGRLVVENRAGSAPPKTQQAILALAARLVSVKDALRNDRPAEAARELVRALGEAGPQKLHVPRALLLVGLVYAGVLEKVLTGELKELPALLGDPESPGLSLSAANVSAVLAGEIQTALGKIPGVDDDLTAEELLLHGLITRRVDYRREAVMAVVSLLKDRRHWSRLLLLVRQQPAEAVEFIDRLMETARSLMISTEGEGHLRLVRPLHHPKVLREALTKLTG